MPTQPSSLNSDSEAATLAGIRRAAEATLAAWPEARAAVLFGSRARGDHLPTSDWDVAFITSNGGNRITDIPAGLPIEALPWDVQALALPEGLARRKALSIGHVGRGVVRDGLVLAGRWARPLTVADPAMEPENYRQLIQNVSNFIGSAAIQMADVGADGDWWASYPSASGFVTQTSDAAEDLAKAMLGRHGMEPERTHGVTDLATQAKQAGHSSLAKDIAEMDGFTRRDHVAVYGGVASYRNTDTDRLNHAIKRLPVVVRQLRRELATVADDSRYAYLFPSLARFISRTAADAETAVRLAVLRDGSDPAPPPEHEELEPLVGARDTLVSELQLLRVGLQPLIATTRRERGVGRSPFD